MRIASSKIREGFHGTEKLRGTEEFEYVDGFNVSKVKLIRDLILTIPQCDRPTGIDSNDSKEAI